MANEDSDGINRKYRYMMEIHRLMLEQQKRYKELKILVVHCAPEDRKDYESTLRYNIQSHHEREFAFNNYEHSIEVLEGIKKFSKEHSYLKHPDLEFSDKIKRGEI